ncbi:MAG: IS5 family transposase [Saprospiraceae bacterium]
MISAILHLLRTGEQWRNLRGWSVPWQSIYYYFRKWRRDGTLIRLNSQLNQKERLRQGKKPTPSMVCIDTQSIKSAPFIDQSKGIDGNKKVNGRKRHLLVDTLGLTWAVVVHAADVADGTTAHLLVEHLLGYLPRLRKILVDQAYKIAFVDWVEHNIASLDVELASKPPSAKGFVPVKWRWVNERTFGWLNFFRRHAKDYEKTVQSSEAWILWANCQIILNRLD